MPDYVTRGLCNRLIAERLSISSKTVCNHMSHIFSKPEVTHRAQAIIIAREAGLGREPR